MKDHEPVPIKTKTTLQDSSDPADPSSPCTTQKIDHTSFLKSVGKLCIKIGSRRRSVPPAGGSPHTKGVPLLGDGVVTRSWCRWGFLSCVPWILGWGSEGADLIINTIGPTRLDLTRLDLLKSPVPKVHCLIVMYYTKTIQT